MSTEEELESLRAFKQQVVNTLGRLLGDFDRTTYEAAQAEVDTWMEEIGDEAAVDLHLADKVRRLGRHLWDLRIQLDTEERREENAEAMAAIVKLDRPLNQDEKIKLLTIALRMKPKRRQGPMEGL